MRFLAGGIAIFDQLATIARFETIAALSASGAFVIVSAHVDILFSVIVLR